MIYFKSMTLFYSFILSFVIIFLLSLIFKAEAVFWWEKIRGKFRRKKEEKEDQEKTVERGMPIEKSCGFRDWSDKGGEYCTLFQLPDGSEYRVTAEICRKCRVWDRYEEWLANGKKEKLSITLIHTLLGSKPMVVETDKLNPELDKGLSFNDFVIKRRRVPWAGKGAIAFFTLVTYLIVYFSGLFTNPVVRANPDDFYFLADGTKAVSGSWNMRTSEPTGGDSTTDCNANDTVAGLYCHLKPGVDNSTYETSYDGPKKLGWMTDNDSLFNGSFAEGTWYIYAEYGWVTNGQCDWAINRIEYKLWQGSSDLSSTTVIKDWTTLCNVTAGEKNPCNGSFELGETSLSDEVLHLEFRQYLETDVCTERPFDFLFFLVDAAGLAERLATPTYAPVPENSLYFAIIVPFIPLIIKRIKSRPVAKKALKI